MCELVTKEAETDAIKHRAIAVMGFITTLKRLDLLSKIVTHDADTTQVFNIWNFAKRFK